MTTKQPGRRVRAHRAYLRCDPLFHTCLALTHSRNVRMHARLIVFLWGLLFAVLGNLRQLWPQIAFKQRRTQDESVWWLQKSALLRRCVPKGALETAQALLLTVCKKNVGSKSMIKKMRISARRGTPCSLDESALFHTPWSVDWSGLICSIYFIEQAQSIRRGL